MKIGELAKRSGLSAHTIRYYERIGLLSKPPRTEGGHRLYNKEQIKRLVFIRRSRELADKYGSRFTPPDYLHQMATKKEMF